MAGIGFELRRVLQRGGIVRFIGVSLAGTAIVAGPWLLSILGIFLIQRTAGLVLTEAPLAFSAAIVYCYAVSLILFGGLHYAFTRQVADLVYEDRNRDAGSALLSCLLLTLAVSAVVALAGVLPLPVGTVVSRPGLFMFSMALLFVSVSCNWILMSFVSLLRSYAGILFVFLGGGVVSLAGVLLLGRPYATAGALLGYAAGQLFTGIILYAMTLSRFRPLSVSLKGLFTGIARHPFLFLTGLLYGWAAWVDKVVAWAAFGRTVPGSWMRVFDAYDIPIFFSILTLIPGLIYFTIQTETAFYPRLREFLRAVSADPWQRIQEKKSAMIRSLGAGLREQCILQGIVSVTLIVLAPGIAQALFGPGVNAATLRMTLAAVWFHALFLSLMVFLFYLELYGRAFTAAMVFFAVNLVVCIATALLAGPHLLGAGYAAGAAAGCGAAGAFLARSIRRMDRVLFVRAFGGR